MQEAVNLQIAGASPVVDAMTVWTNSKSLSCNLKVLGANPSIVFTLISNILTN